ncbi:xanthine dehydrogenase family protein subunit M [Alphaproteobacteria bacterium]|nr:xanthine dehydrogenase family protein subunit M [Alphaproteobacteria bacterium]
MHDFNYHKTSNIEEAVKVHMGAEDGTYMAGGQTLLPTLKQRLAAPTDIIDIAGVTELNTITVSDDVFLGSMATHASVANSSEVSSAIPALATLAAGIGDPQVRNRGTIGGSVANNDPAADYPAACLALNATITTNRRKIVADDFFTGMFETALEENELITSVSFPKPDKAAYMKFPNPASRYAIVGVFVALFGTDVRVAVTGAGDNGVFRPTKIENALSSSFTASALDDTTISPDDLLSDIHAQSDYRASLIITMAKRAVAAAS